MFKNVILGIFIAGALLAMAMFAGIIKIGGKSTSTTVVKGTAVMWGTFSFQSMQPLLSDFKDVNGDINIQYVEKNPATFSSDITESIAAGNPPDLILMPDNLIKHFKDQIVHIPFTSIPADTYTNTFISAANIFVANDGIVALPWAADPMILYYNRDMLQSAGYAKPPAKWQDFTDSIKLLTIKQNDMTITQNAAALGTYSNIAHAKDIIALLFLQTGNPFMTYDYSHFTAYLGGGGTTNERDIANQVMAFYTAFSNPVKAVYSWNAGEPLDRDLFEQSSLAYYFGSASELPAIRAKNPNLNFGIALPPQSPTGTIVTTGRIFGIAIPKSAKNQLLSFTAASLLTNSAAEASLSGNSAVTLALLPVRRDVLSGKQVSDQYLNFLYKTVIVQKSWFDPDPIVSDKILGGAIRDINSSLMTIDEALGKAETQLEATGNQ
ncbi:MAG: extracellular solute-binding protein [bacterium]